MILACDQSTDHLQRVIGGLTDHPLQVALTAIPVIKSCSDTKTCVEVKHEGSLQQGNHPAHDHFKNNQEIQFLKKECTCSGVTAGCCVLPLPALKAYTSSCLLLQNKTIVLFWVGFFWCFLQQSAAVWHLTNL